MNENTDKEIADLRWKLSDFAARESLLKAKIMDLEDENAELKRWRDAYRNAALEFHNGLDFMKASNEIDNFAQRLVDEGNEKHN